MDWLTQMNEALDYIESHLTDEIDLDEIGRITACPAGLFQRIFPKIIGIPLSEYIRRRKLTLAAYDLQVSDCKVEMCIRDRCLRCVHSFCGNILL